MNLNNSIFKSLAVAIILVVGFAGGVLGERISHEMNSLTDVTKRI